MISSSIPYGAILDLSGSSKTVMVGLIFFKFRYFIVSSVITLIVAPKSINVFEIEKLSIVIVTIGNPGSIYLKKK